MNMTEAGSPTVRRRELAARLRAARQRSGLTIDDVSAKLGGNRVRSLHRWEAADALLSSPDLVTLCDIYEVTPAEREQVLILRSEALRPGWWTPYTSAIAPTYSTFVDLESGADALKEYSGIMVPGLFQTNDYMSAVMRAANPPMSDETIKSRIAVRTRRQTETLTRVASHFIIDEGALLRGVGGTAVMRAQLETLAAFATSRLITVQVLALSAGVTVSTVGNFSILLFERSQDPPIVGVETLTGCLFADDTDGAQYIEAFNRVRKHALSARQSLARIRDIRNEVYPNAH
jgi:hypothetical protein